jgi:hypothetical protein
MDLLLTYTHSIVRVDSTYKKKKIMRRDSIIRNPMSFFIPLEMEFWIQITRMYIPPQTLIEG